MAQTIAVVAPGDMGGAVGAALKKTGKDVIGILSCRSIETRLRAEESGFRDVGNFKSLVSEADLVLSIVPPAVALEVAQDIATAMRGMETSLTFIDCNAVSPQSVQKIAGVVGDAGASFVDCGIIGLPPGRTHQPTRFYVSGENVEAALDLAVEGISVRTVSGGVGRASNLKMLYAGINKARFSLYALIATAAEASGLTKDLFAELEYSQTDVLDYMRNTIQRLPADSERWAPELREIAATMRAIGVSGEMHDGAAWILNLMSRTSFASETRQTIDINRSLETTLKTFVEQLKLE